MQNIPLTSFWTIAESEAEGNLYMSLARVGQAGSH